MRDCRDDDKSVTINIIVFHEITFAGRTGEGWKKHVRPGWRRARVHHTMTVVGVNNDCEGCGRARDYTTEKRIRRQSKKQSGRGGCERRGVAVWRAWTCAKDAADNTDDAPDCPRVRVCRGGGGDDGGGSCTHVYNIYIYVRVSEFADIVVRCVIHCTHIHYIRVFCVTSPPTRRQISRPTGDAVVAPS